MRRRGLEVDPQQLLLARDHAKLDRRRQRRVAQERACERARPRGARSSVVPGFVVAGDRSAASRVAPSAATLRATLAAPPGRSSMRVIFATGTGASGDMRSTSPNQ